MKQLICSIRQVPRAVSSLRHGCRRYGASLGGSLCKTSKMYVRQVGLTSHESKTAQKAQATWQTTPSWCWSCSPLQRRGFDEPMPPEGWAVLRMFVSRPHSKRFNRLNKLKKIWIYILASCSIKFGLVRRRLWWPKRHPLSLAAANKIRIN